MGHLQELVQEYLTLTRLAVLPRESEDLGVLLEALALEMRDILTARGVALRLEAVAGLGQVALHKPSFARALRKMVQHVIETMPQGSMLTMRGRRTDTHIHLDICEANSGASAEQAILLSRPFIEPERAELGLSLVREVIVAHQGEITVRHEPGVGTTFTVALPLLPAGEAQEE
jgi:signal transduction histidine kinase